MTEEGRVSPSSLSLSSVERAKFPPAESPPKAICLGEYPCSSTNDYMNCNHLQVEKGIDVQVPACNQEHK